MAEMREFLEISKDALSKPIGSVAQLAVFVDEGAYKYGSASSFVYNFRETVGKIGAPYDCYLAADYERVKDRYSAIIVLDPYRTSVVDSMISDAESRKIGCLVITRENADMSTRDLRNFCKENSVYLYTEEDAVVYANESYIFVHSCCENLPEISIPKGKKLRSLFESEATRSMHPKYVSALYEFE
jgi:hypothetical protein